MWVYCGENQEVNLDDHSGENIKALLRQASMKGQRLKVEMMESFKD